MPGTETRAPIPRSTSWRAALIYAKRGACDVDKSGGCGTHGADDTPPTSCLDRPLDHHTSQTIRPESPMRQRRVRAEQSGTQSACVTSPPEIERRLAGRALNSG